jgi:hypothetical protein
MAQLGGKRAYSGRLGRDRSALETRHPITGAKHALPPEGDNPVLKVAATVSVGRDGIDYVDAIG